MLWVNAHELCRHFLGQPLAEIILPCVAREILEGKNRQDQSSVGRLRVSAHSRPDKIADGRCHEECANCQQKRSSKVPHVRYVSCCRRGEIGRASCRERV